MTKKLKPSVPFLNIGCGNFPAVGYVNVDITDVGGPKPDVIGSILDLPFTASSVKRVYAGHVLEHITLEDLPKALSEVERVLQKGGEFAIVGPDADRARIHFPEMLNDILHGGHRWEGDEHTWESTETAMLRILAENGWIVRSVPIESEELDGWPVTSRIGWQFAVFATKS